MAGCKGHEPAENAAPLKKPPLTVAPGVTRWEKTIDGPSGDPMTVWIYMPSPAPAKPVPCILIGPAGSLGFVGMSLGDGDVPEHIPYAQAGYIVVSYSLDGDTGEDRTYRTLRRGFEAFNAARAGTENARLALEFALKNIPQIDSTQIFTAGHSSAGTLSLQVAETNPRIKGCIAYAPCTDFLLRWGDEERQAIPQLDEFARQYAPINHASSLHCPLFLFHADDDSNVPSSDNIAFVNAVRSGGNSDVTFARVLTGNHYDSMIDEGIPDAIQWLGTHTLH